MSLQTHIVLPELSLGQIGLSACYFDTSINHAPERPICPRLSSGKTMCVCKQRHKVS